MKISYFGIPGSFTHIAAQQYFPDKDTTVFVGGKKFADIFEDIVNGDSTHGVVAVENTTSGSILEVYDLLQRHNVTIMGEVGIHITYVLAGIEQIDIEAAKDVYVNRIAASQCHLFLQQHESLRQVLSPDNASSARIVHEQKDNHTFAITNKRSAETYGLTILKEHIEDSPHNITRFIILTKGNDHTPSYDHANKASIIFTLPHEPGTLNTILSLLAKKSINVTKIESRPIPDRPFEYIFYLDMTWQPIHGMIEPIMQELKRCTRMLRVAGIYTSSTQPL